MFLRPIVKGSRVPFYNSSAGGSSVAFSVTSRVRCGKVVGDRLLCIGGARITSTSTSTARRATMTAAAFERLIRFETPGGEIKYGDLGKAVPTKEIEGREVEVLEGDIKAGFKKSGGKAKVGKLLSPLPDTPIILCVGLNYKRHAEECNLQIPTHPAIFTKPTTALTGPLSTIPIHPACTPQLDYEGELTLVISRDCKNVPASAYKSVLLGYTISNDVSARNFQMPASVSGGQFGYAKSFDGFAPLGPCVVAPEVVEEELGGVDKLRIRTRVNGETRQDGGCDDMIYEVGKVVEHLSRGTTLKAGTCILTGTPSGVGLFMNPQGFLKDGDVVEVEVEGIGSIINTVEFEKDPVAIF